MKFIIIGSGGCVCTPKPLCQCAVCREARTKGFPHARCSCSLYLEEAALLVDTPEDIAMALNNADIRTVDHILYSHWDPDHTLGMRIMEQLRLEWLDVYENKLPATPITVTAQAEVMADINRIASKYGSFLDYYESMHLIRRQSADQLKINNIEISLIAVPDAAVTVFLFESQGKKVIYAPCDCRPFPEEERFRNADVLIIGNTVIGGVVKNNRVLPPDSPVYQELYAMNEVMDLQRMWNIREVVITHLEECWGRSIDDYREIEKNLKNVRFAVDGMIIEV